MMKILKIFLAVIAPVTLLVATGCSEIAGLTGGSSSNTPDIIRGSELGDDWRMDQLLVNVEADDESMVLLRLDYGDRVDGYFYMEKGSGINFRVTGNSLIYEATDNESESKVSSSRFSFRASEAQGNTYTMTFYNPAKTKATVFLEVIYPVDGSLFMPIERE